MSEQRKRLIVVLGMHRSGTSMITRGLNVLGVELGNKLLPPVQGDNDKGYFEDIDFNALNIEMLQAIGSGWSGLAPIESSDLENLHQRGYFLRAVDLLRKKTTDVSIFGVKDPRIAKLLPFWQRVFAHCDLETGYVLAIRNPLSVVKSMAKRGQLGSEESYLLWLVHVLTSLANTGSHPRVLVDYDQFLDAPQISLAHVAKQLSLQVDTQALQEYLSEFLDKTLRHSEYTAKDLALDQACPPLVQEIYVELVKVARDNKPLNKSEFRNFTKNWNDEFQRLKSSLHWMDQLSTKIYELNQSILNQSVSTQKAENTALIKLIIELDPQAFQRIFDSQWYLQHYTDLTTSGVDPYQHYIHYGVAEGRLPAADTTTFVLQTLLERSSELNQIRQIAEIRLTTLDESEEVFSEQLQAGQQEFHRLEQEQAQREQEIATQLLAIQHQANAEKTELGQQHQAHLQEIQHQQVEHERLAAEHIQTLRQELRHMQADNGTREQEHAEALTSLQNELVAQLRMQAQHEQEHLIQLEAQLEELDNHKAIYFEHLEEMGNEYERKINEQIQLAGERNRTLEIYQETLERVRRELTGMRGVLLQSPFAISNKFGEMPPNHGEDASVTVEELLGCHDEQFIRITYHTLLGRDPDADGLSYYLGRLRNGISKAEILSQIRFGKEGSSRQNGVVGLEQLITRHRRQYRSLHQRVARLLGLQLGKSMQDLRSMENQYHRLDAQGRQFVIQIERSLSRLKIVAPNNVCEPEKQIDETSKTQLTQTVAVTPVFEIGGVKATVAILTKNPGDIFKKVLPSVLGQDTPWPYEVIVVDSGSSDGTIDFVKQFSRVRLFQIKSSDFGHGRTRNFAVSMAQGQYVAMLTHDAMPVTTSWLESLVKPLDEDPTIAGVFGRHKAYDEHSAYTKRDIELHFNGFLQWPAIMGIEDPERYNREQGYRQVLHFFSDNNACLRKAVWAQISYPDVNFAEDQLWAKAVIEAGYKRAYADDAVVYHSHDYSIKDTFRRSFDESRALKTLFGYDLCPTAKHGLTQIKACTKADLKYMESIGVRNSFGLNFNTLFLHIAKQTGWYIGRYRGRLERTIFWLFSLDDAKKRKNNNAMLEKLKTLFSPSKDDSANQSTAGDVNVATQKHVSAVVKPSANVGIDVISFYDFVITEDAGVLPKDSREVDNMSINWLIPDFGIGSGGHLNIFRFISMLENKGYKNTILLIGGHRHATPEDARRMICEHFFDLKADVVFEMDNLPAARFSFATSWITAYALRGFGATCHKLYFVQDFEPSFYSKGSEYDFAEETYKFGFTAVCAGDWLACKLATDYGMKTHSVSFSYDRDLYVQTHRREPEKLRVFCYMRPPTIRRGLESSMLALSLVGNERPDVEFIFAGWDMGNYHFPYPHLNGGLLSVKELPDLYSQCDVALVFSFTNLSLLPLELMACGCVVVSNRAPNTEWLLNDENSILPKSASPRSIANSIIDILDDAPRRIALAHRAKAFSQSTNWLDEGEKFIDILNGMGRSYREVQ